jgi:hypothetical protein
MRENLDQSTFQIVLKQAHAYSQDFAPPWPPLRLHEGLEADLAVVEGDGSPQRAPRDARTEVFLKGVDWSPERENRAAHRYLVSQARHGLEPCDAEVPRYPCGILAAQRPQARMYMLVVLVQTLSGLLTWQRPVAPYPGSICSILGHIGLWTNQAITERLPTAHTPSTIAARTTGRNKSLLSGSLVVPS